MTFYVGLVTAVTGLIFTGGIGFAKLACDALGISTPGFKIAISASSFVMLLGFGMMMVGGGK
jgi:hypothetical protein